MTVEQALQILTQTTAQLSATREVHAQIIAALEALKKATSK